MNNTPTTPTPDDDPAKQAAILIAKLTIVLSELKQQIAATAQATAKLDKLVREEVQARIAEQISNLDTNMARRHESEFGAIRRELAALAALLDRRFVGLHLRLIIILIALVVVGGLSVVCIFS